MRNSYFVLLACLLSCSLAAQTGAPWTLERAVDYALENNLQVKRLNNFAEISRVNKQQALNGRLPTLSGSTNIGAQFGRTVDPTTNEFRQQTIGFQGYQLQAGVTLYNGGQIKNSLRQAELDLAAAELDTKVTGNNIGLQVANTYLNVVLLKEQLKNARVQLATTEDQLENTEALIRAGAVPAAQRFDLEAQRASNQQTIVELENQVTNGTLSLQLLLELDYDAAFEIATPELNPTEAQLFETFNLEEVYLSARGTQPTVAAAEVRRDAAAVGLDLAKAGMRPTVTLFGSVSTNFSTAAKTGDFSSATFETVPAPDFVVDGQPGRVSRVQFVGGDFSTIGYFKQLNNNFGQSAGASLNVPIYSQGRNRLNVQRAELQRLNAELDIEQADNQLRNDVTLALANLRAAQQSYRAAQVSQRAAQVAYENAQRRFKAGAANSLDLVTAANRFEQAQTELTRNKYQLIFNRQVIKFYLGNGLSLD